MGGKGKLFQFFLVFGFFTFFTIGFPHTSSADNIFGPSVAELTVRETLKQYKEIKRVDLELLNRFPPSEYVYVGIGRSPTPFMSLLQATVGQNAAVNVPLTDMSNFKPGGYVHGLSPGNAGYVTRNGVTTPVVYDPINYERLVLRLRKHFDYFLPRPSDLKGKKILLFDFASTAESLINSKREISNYYQALTPGQPIRVEAIGIPEAEDSEKALKDNRIEVISVSKKVRKYLTQTQFKNLAEYGQFMATEVYGNPAFEAAPKRITRDSKTDHLEGYDTLTEAFKLEASGDQPFMKTLSQIIPDAPILKHPVLNSPEASYVSRFIGCLRRSLSFP
jgi:hypothetical protein